MCSVSRTEVLEYATELFEGDKERAILWLCRPKWTLSGRCYMGLMPDVVFGVIFQMEHGVYP